MKKAIAFRTIALLIISVIVVTGVLLFFLTTSSRGFSNFRIIFGIAENQVALSENISKIWQCEKLLKLGHCEEYNRLNCTEILGKECS